MNLKKIVIAIVTILIFFGLATKTNAQDPAKIYFFYGNGCPHCSLVEQYFEENDLYDRYPIEKKEIYFNRDNAVLYSIMLDKLKYPIGERGVPTVVIGDKMLVGDKPIIDNFISEADKFLENDNDVNIATPTMEEKKAQITPSASEEEKEKTNIDLTLAAVVGASAVDAINPCAFAVLIILMTTILASGGGKKALKSGVAFAISIFISYFLMGFGLYRALGLGGVAGIFYKVVGWLAIILGLFNLKDYFWYGKGFLMEVPMGWRPALKGLIRSVTTPLGAFAIGFLVSLFLLPCTSGPYIVILGMLAKNVLQTNAIFYLALYNLIFVLPMIIITLAVYKGFNPAKAEAIRQKRLKTLHLIAGIIMLAMGIVVLVGWI
jgi:cytochrome c biogenesis protein CcdA/glutaredoxin